MLLFVATGIVAGMAGTGRFGKDISAKKLETFLQIFHAETSRIILVLFLVFNKQVRSSL